MSSSSNVKLFLPFDVILYIIDVLASSEEMETLRTFSQTCRLLLPFCRQHLFSTIDLQFEIPLRLFGVPSARSFTMVAVKKRNRVLASLNTLLDRNPAISSYVRRLRYSYHEVSSEHIPSILHRLQKVQSFQFSNSQFGGVGNWADIPSAIQLAVLHILQSPALTRLAVRNFLQFPVAALSACINIKYLDIYLFHMRGPFEAPQTLLSLPQPTVLTSGLCSDAVESLVSGSGSLLDFSRVEKFSVKVDDEYQLHSATELIKLARQSIRDIICSVQGPTSLSELAEAMNGASFPSLRSLTIDFWLAYHNDSDPIFGLHQMLDAMQTQSTIAEVNLVFIDSPSRFMSISAEHWSELDTVLFELGKSIHLHHISLRMHMVLSRTDMGGNSIAEVQNMEHTVFSKLSSSETVTFRFTTTS